MDAADRKGKRIGCIFGLGWLRKAQKRLNRFLYLELARRTYADDGQFGFFGSKFVDGDASSGSCEIDHSLGHAEFDSALRIFQDELRFDGDGNGL